MLWPRMISTPTVVYLDYSIILIWQNLNMKEWYVGIDYLRPTLHIH